MHYQNFDLWIEPGNGNGYPLRALSEQFGIIRDSMELSPNDPKLQESLRRLDHRETDRDFLVHFGSELYSHLLTGKIDALFQQSYGAVMSREDWGLRLRLRIEAPELAVLPWEFLYSTMAECFLGTMIRFPILRYLDFHKPIRKLETPFPLRILVAIPGRIENYAVLETENEKHDLQEALSDVQDLTEVTFLENKVSITDISDELLQKRYHCLHFIGHGQFQDDHGYLLLNNGRGGGEAVDETRFAELFRNHETLKLVVLNSCKGASGSSTRPFVGMAPRLVQLGIPAVVAMQYAIYDDVALEFARTFYRSLFKGWSKGNVEVAVSEARNHLAGRFPNDRDMATPVLFLRAPEGVLFNPVTGSFWHDLPWKRQNFHTQQAVGQTYEKNLTILWDSQQYDPAPATEQAIRENLKEFESLKQRIRFRNYLLATIPGVILLFFYLSWTSLFDLFTLDTRIETGTIWLGDRFATKTFNDELVLVTIDDKSEQFFGKPFDISWRREHALVIDRLSKAGSKVIAFGLTFDSGSEFDDELIQAVRVAQQRGTAVVIGTAAPKDTEVELLWKAVDGYGPCCMGKKLGLASVASLAVFQDGGPCVQSFTLATLAAYHDTKLCAADQERKVLSLCNTDGRGLETIHFSALEPAKQDQSDCQIRKGDGVADLFIDLSPLDALRDPSRRHSYESFFQNLNIEEQVDFEGKIVLVGKAGSKIETPEGERFSFDLQADAVNTILNGVTIRSLGQSGQLVIMIGLGLLGAFVRYRIPPRPHYLRISLFLFFLFLYLGSTIFVYSQYHVLLNTLYHVGAFGTAYWATGKVEKKWMT